MHQTPRLRRSWIVLSTPQSGFSLVEVTLALGIIAFAFVALFGLLPVGLGTFRSAIDTNNEARIVQGIVGKAIATNYNNLKKQDPKEIYYFDEEGSATDTSLFEVPARKDERIYEAKYFVEDAVAPTNAPTKMSYSVNLLLMFCSIYSPAAKAFDEIQTAADLRNYLEDHKGQSEFKVRAILISKMDGED